jgi:predicted phage terminase large subunit-like protein
MTPIGLASLATDGRYQASAVHDILNRTYMMMVQAATTPSIKRHPYRRVVISIPPRFGKSDIFSVYGPAWFMGNFGHLNAGIVTYEATFSEGFGRKARNVLEWLGPEVFGVTVSPRSAASDWWETVDAHNTKHNLGGSLRAMGIGGPTMGKGFNILGIDDPTKNAQEALSKTIQDGQWEWYQTAAKTRMEPGGAMAIIMQRWHENDLAGRTMREEGLYSQGGAWTPIVMPLYAEPITYQHVPGLIGTLPDPLGRAEGELLWPGRFTPEELAEKRRTTPAFWWAAQYQQRPTTPEGTLFSREAIRYFEDLGDYYRIVPRYGLPEVIDKRHVRRFIVVDLAASLKTSADYTVMGVFGVTPKKQLLVLNWQRQRMEGPDAERVLDTLYNLERPISGIFVESVAYQLAFVQAMRRRGWPMRELKADRDKYARALFASTRVDGDGLFLPARATWKQALEDEMLSFPFGGHDDQVDVLGYACLVVGGPGAGGIGNAIRIIQ